MEGKTFLIGIIFILLISFSYADCEDFDYSVTYIGKDGTGCYDGLQIIIENPDCQNSCFSEFDNITLSTDIEDIITISPTDSISSPLIIIKENFNCSNGVPTKFLADLNGAESCNFMFDLGEEFKKKTIYDKEKECKAIDKVYNATSDSCVDKPEEDEGDIEIIESERVQDNDNDDRPSRISGRIEDERSVIKRIIPSNDEPEEVTLPRNSVIESNDSIKMVPKINNQINLTQEQNVSTNNVTVRETNNNFIIYFIYIFSTVILILLIITIIMIKTKKKKKIRKK